jgi:DNA-binding transcriptional MerR regulator
VDTSHTISAVAARTGFTPSALRFYEGAGLIRPERSESGYRLYDERSVERLRFISRAKQLGLRLDEITDLLRVWDDDECAPVAARLQGLVDEKLAATQRRIAELVALAGDLQRFRSALVVDEISGPCGDRCACHADARPEPVAAAVVAKPDRTNDAPAIACGLAPDDMTDRMGEWQQLLARANGAPTRVEGGVTLHFDDPNVAAEIGALAAAEESCCSFFTFDIRMSHQGTDLTVTAPPDALPLVDALFGARRVWSAGTSGA